MISIVIPVYNVQDYLPQCLDSLDFQAGFKMEVIIVNDGSTDDSLSVCKEYAQRHSNVVVIDKENGGLSDARNAGTKVATGEYIYYLDSDDWLTPNAIKTLYDYAIENDCEIVQGGFFYAYDNYLLYDNKYKKSFVLDRQEAMLELIKNDYVKNFAWGKLYRADVVKKYPFPKGKYYEDSFWQHLVVHECNRYGVVPTPLYYYRQRNMGISGKFSLKNMDLLRGYEERLKFVLGIYPQFTNHIVSVLWHQAFFFKQLASKTNNDELRCSYESYYEKLFAKYHDLINDALKKDIEFRLANTYPVLLPIYGIYMRIRDYFTICRWRKFKYVE